METHDLTDASRNALSRLLQLDEGDKSEWNTSDLQAILKHQLDAEIEFDLTHFGDVAKETTASIATSSGEKGPGTFGQVLSSPEPPLEMLELIHRFAKRGRTHARDGMPQEVATVLYYAAIGVARLRHRASISKLDDEAILNGLDWGLQQPWMVASLKALFAETIEAIRSAKREADA